MYYDVDFEKDFKFKKHNSTILEQRMNLEEKQQKQLTFLRMISGNKKNEITKTYLAKTIVFSIIFTQLNYFAVYGSILRSLLFR